MMKEQEMEIKMDELAGKGNWELLSAGRFTMTYRNLTTGSKTTFTTEDFYK